MQPLLTRARKSTFTLMMLIICVLITACNSSTIDFNTDNSNGISGTGAQGLQVFVEPDAGYQVITDAISKAEKSVWVEVYLLTEKHVISALEEAAHDGKDVRVMLEGHPYGGGSVSPQQTIDTLNAAGVKAETTNPKFALTHEKGMIIDEKTAYILTANLTASALGGSSSTKNREYGIIDTNDKDVQTIIDIFNADWDRKNLDFDNNTLVVSPLNSRDAFLSLIKSAKKTLLVEAEEMQDDQVEQALISAVKDGVDVQVILPKPQSSDDNNGDGINTISDGGVKVKLSSKLYMHAKIFVVDGKKAFVGSENISTASLERNRELGILIADNEVLNTLQKTFEQDWSASKSA
ncbi:phospholipase D-like domain-containing protein [Ktedonospora formicarum]|uniref:phospholipase D n=1 Tax=Ktedonospora formicarum TaxID=2778364 RepID=A0A8J3MS79_9CHLR|nr:phospholipase D-like domain-containing protein [Ktedonospora formicarum]GHO43055.1 hypothetical protein KSX_12180 [Ktedonospora formicarum]